MVGFNHDAAVLLKMKSKDQNIKSKDQTILEILNLKEQLNVRENFGAKIQEPDCQIA